MRLRASNCRLTVKQRQRSVDASKCRASSTLLSSNCSSTQSVGPSNRRRQMTTSHKKKNFGGFDEKRERWFKGQNWQQGRKTTNHATATCSSARYPAQPLPTLLFIDVIIFTCRRLHFFFFPQQPSMIMPMRQRPGRKTSSNLTAGRVASHRPLHLRPTVTDDDIVNDTQPDPNTSANQQKKKNTISDKN